MLKKLARELFISLTCCALVACASAATQPSASHSVFVDRIDTQTQRCEQVSIEELWNNPWSHADKRLCISGYLGHMVSYGEESVELYATPEEAKLRQSDRYITLSLPLTMKLQEELARYSDSKLKAVGTFHFDQRCWPQNGEKESRYQCFPPRPMKLLNAIVAVAK